MTISEQTAFVPQGASEGVIAASSGKVLAVNTRTVTVGSPTVAASSSGWQPMQIGHCYTMNNKYTAYNWVGWKQYTATLQTYNWCPDGSHDGDGMWSSLQNFHGYQSWGYCDNTGIQSGYIAPNQWGWQSSVTARFGWAPSFCNLEGGINLFDQFWGNGHWNWNDSLSS